jgi:hypothetical protein
MAGTAAPALMILMMAMQALQESLDEKRLLLVAGFPEQMLA